MSDDLIKELRALSRCEHDDLYIGDEAADEIERLRRLVELAYMEGWCSQGVYDSADEGWLESDARAALKED
jgi:hypothetical protein